MICLQGSVGSGQWTGTDPEFSCLFVVAKEASRWRKGRYVCFQCAEKHLFVRGVDRRGERCAKGTIRIVEWGELCGRLSEVHLEGAFVENLAFDALQADCADPNRDIGSRRPAAAK